jgi:hypothetical protein
MAIYAKRFIKGVLYTGISAYYICHEHGTNELGSNNKWEEAVSKWAEGQSAFVSGATSWAMFILSLFILALFAKGLYYLFTMHVESVPSIDETSLIEKLTIGGGPSNNDEDNIDRIKKYRDSKLSAMPNSKAAAEYKKTAWIDAIPKHGGSRTQSVRRYINSQLSAKSNEQAYEWLKRNDK